MPVRVPDPSNWRFERAPTPRRPAVELIKVEPSEKPLDLVIVSHALVGIHTHYIDGRTCPCTGPQGVCHVDHQFARCDWHGYLTVKRPYVTERRLLCLTKYAVAGCPRLEKGGLDLRGGILRVKRLGKSIRSKLSAYLDPENYACHVGVLDVDIVAELERMWDAPPRLGNRPAAIKGNDLGEGEVPL